MKVIVCNYRYFISGGPERYMFSLFDVLRKNGDEAIPFSVAYAKNQESEYADYFVAPPGDPTKVYFNELNLSLPQKIRAAKNVVYSSEAKSKLKRLIQETKPDIIQTLQIHTVLSYSLIDAAKEHGLPVIARMSNYQLMCPSEHFLRDYQVCEDCTQSMMNAIKHKCVQDSTAASFLRTFSLWLHRNRKTFDKVDYFIVPSRFLKTKMVESGFPDEKIVYIPTFVNVDEFEPSYKSEDYVVYAGRIAMEKGIPELIEAFSKVKSRTKLKLIGNYDSPEGQKVMNVLGERTFDNIEFLGYKPLPELKQIVSKALFAVCPSIWYENSPISIIESFASGKPVLGTRLGSIEEQIIDGETGMLFEPGNIDDFAAKIEAMISDKQRLVEMGKAARSRVEQWHSPAAHFEKLMSVYQDVMSS